MQSSCQRTPFGNVVAHFVIFFFGFFGFVDWQVLNASSDDLIMAYVKWGTVEADEVSKSTPGGVPLVNVSKALRRITALMEFVQEHSDSVGGAGRADAALTLRDRRRSRCRSMICPNLKRCTANSASS